MSTDGTNDSDSKLYPVVVRYENSVSGLVDCTLLSVLSSNMKLDTTGENVA